MRRLRWIASGLAPVLVALALSSCGGGSPTTGPTTTSSTSAARSTTTSTSTSPTTAVAVTARATVSPDQGVAGTSLAFAVEINGPGTLGGEGVTFGDGASSGANAGDVHCGDTARADHTSSTSTPTPERGPTSSATR